MRKQRSKSLIHPLSTSLTYIVWRLLNIENKITCCCCFFLFCVNFVAFIPRRVTVFCWEPYLSQNFVAYFLTFSLLTFAVAIADLPKESFDGRFKTRPKFSFLKLCRDYSNSLRMSNGDRLSCSYIFGIHSNFRKRKKNSSSCVYVLHWKRRTIRK